MRPPPERRNRAISTCRRFAVYYTPPPGALADFGASWLGWDIVRGRRAARSLDVPGAGDATATPRRYGFHATLKPPFRLAHGQSRAALEEAVAEAAAATPAVLGAELRMARLGRFLALVPASDHAPFGRLGAEMVRRLDPFRAPPSEEELARRRAGGLTEEEDRNLLRWGYPHVMESFRFHMTLTGPLDPATAERIEAALAPAVAGAVPRPFEIREVTLAAEDAESRFHALHRYALSG